MNQFITLLAAALLFAPTLKAEEAPTIVEMDVPLHSAFVPGGFDSQSDAFVIVSGVFPNTCYSWSRADVSQQEGSTQIDVIAKANVTQGVACFRFLVPYQKEVNLGRLAAGSYSVRFGNGDGTYFYETIEIRD